MYNTTQLTQTPGYGSFYPPLIPQQSDRKTPDSVSPAENSKGLARTRWEQKKDLCKRDLALKGLCVAAIVAVGIVVAAGLIAGAVVCPTAGIILLAAYGTLFVGGVSLGVAGGLACSSDWRNYSNPNTTNKAVAILSGAEDPVNIGQREKKLSVKTLERYGIISHEIGAKIRDYREEWKTNTKQIGKVEREYTTQYINKNPNGIFDRYNEMKKRQQDLENEWIAYRDDIIAENVPYPPVMAN